MNDLDTTLPSWIRKHPIITTLILGVISSVMAAVLMEGNWAPSVSFIRAHSTEVTAGLVVLLLLIIIVLSVLYRQMKIQERRREQERTSERERGTLAQQKLEDELQRLKAQQPIARVQQETSLTQPKPATPLVDELRKRLASYSTWPPQGSERYYVKHHEEDEPSRDADTPTYHFFADVDLERFCGFMIPPLDHGHGRDENFGFSDNWLWYLEMIDKRAPEHGQKDRIVFFDRMLLHLFLFDTDRIILDAQIENSDLFFQQKEMLGVKFKTLDWEPPATDSARRVVRYVHDFAKIHRQMLRGRIVCRYVSKSTVPASSYHDFGLYRIDGVDIVYEPIPFKNKYKSIAQERVYIGDGDAQRREITKFEDEFNSLWDWALRKSLPQKDQWSDFNSKRLETKSDKCYTSPCYYPEYFDVVYGQRINAFLKKLGVDVDQNV